jgi:integrase
MPKAKRRNQKNRVHVTSRKGRLRLRWSYLGKPWEMYLSLPDSPINREGARRLALEIEQDIALREFDQTLGKYRPKLDTPEPATIAAVTIGDRWAQWMQDRRDDGVKNQTLTNRYQTIANLLKHFGRDLKSVDDARQFIDYLRNRQSARTSNRNLQMLRAFGNWCVDQGFWGENLFTPIKAAKDSNRDEKEWIPFTPSEIEAILTTFKLHRSYSVYHDFALTLLSLGLRPSEAIGLQWRHIDLARMEITISDSLSRSGYGSRRTREDRKTGTTTRLDMPDHIATMLKGRFTPGTHPDDLVFPSPKGKTIDDRNFSQRAWKMVLEKAGVAHRPPYNSRHTMGSVAIDQGATYPEVAYLMGHKDTQMVIKTYGHKVRRPQLPKLTP